MGAWGIQRAYWGQGEKEKGADELVWMYGIGTNVSIGYKGLEVVESLDHPYPESTQHVEEEQTLNIWVVYSQQI